ncbi:MAG: sulfatase [Candidatus Methanomethylicaceae archaeon]
MDKFASKAIVFKNAYPGGLPTLPVRYELMTGQFTLPYRGWGPLNPEEITIAEILNREGYVCGLITDTYHFFKPGMNYHKGFHSFRWVRGQEYDAFVSSPPFHKKLENYVKPNFPEEWKRLVQQFLSNTDEFKKEEDWFPYKVVNEAIDWLKKNRVHKKIFLWIDCFDPHEPWDPPERFDIYTDPSYKGPRLILPMGGYANEWATEEEINHIRGLYAGEVSFVDYCLGKLFSTLEELGYYDDSIIVFLSDHGHPLADHGKFLKGTDRLYNELLKVPFMIRFPGCKPRVTEALIQFHDFLPTILTLIGLENNTYSMHGKSFHSVLLDNVESHRNAIITGYYEHVGRKFLGMRISAVDRCIRNQKWSYIQRPEGQLDELYNLIEDPFEKNNLIKEYPEEAEKLTSMFGKYFLPTPKKWLGTQAAYELKDTGVRI